MEQKSNYVSTKNGLQMEETTRYNPIERVLQMELVFIKALIPC